MRSITQWYTASYYSPQSYCLWSYCSTGQAFLCQLNGYTALPLCVNSVVYKFMYISSELYRFIICQLSITSF